MSTLTAPGVGRQRAARERILESAYELFLHRGVRDVGINEVIARAGVTKATLYHHFASKDELVMAFLELREQRWTHAWLDDGARQRRVTPEARLLGIFDLFDEWFRRDEFEACSFINVLLEMRASHPTGQASIRHLDNIREVVRRLAVEANLRDPAAFARSFDLLMKGSIVSAVEGDVGAARRAKTMARALMERHRRPVGR